VSIAGSRLLQQYFEYANQRVPERSEKPVPREGAQQGGLDGATMLEQVVATPAKFVRRGQEQKW